MFKSGFILHTNEHIIAAMHNKTPVSVWMQGKIVDYGGVIDEFNGKSVKINGEWHPLIIEDGTKTIQPIELRIR